MKFKFFFIGKIPSKANYKKISHRRINGELKPFIMNNPQVLSSQREALYQLHLQKLSYGLDKFPITKPVKVSLTFYLSGRVRQRDIDNAEKFVGDILEKGEILKRDSLIYQKERVEKRLGIK
ncbi:MAG: RusA family crossover junction endodeoxyribonuclease, partial [Desulfurobacteriaceae bacterium]